MLNFNTWIHDLKIGSKLTCFIYFKPYPIVSLWRILMYLTEGNKYMLLLTCTKKRVNHQIKVQSFVLTDTSDFRLAGNVQSANHEWRKHRRAGEWRVWWDIIISCSHHKLNSADFWCLDFPKPSIILRDLGVLTVDQ